MRIALWISLWGFLSLLDGSAAIISRDQDEYRTCWYRESTLTQSDLLEKNFARWLSSMDRLASKAASYENEQV